GCAVDAPVSDPDSPYHRHCDGAWTRAVSRGVSTIGGGVGPGPPDHFGRGAFDHGRTGPLVFRRRRVTHPTVHDGVVPVWRRDIQRAESAGPVVFGRADRRAL